MDTKYNYLQAMIEDIEDALPDYYQSDELMERLEENRNELEQDLRDKLWIDDSVTGNASGSYTFNSSEAGKHLIDNLDLYREAVNEFGIDANAIVQHIDDPEYMDVTIRCYLLPQAISEVLNGLDGLTSTN